MFDFALVTLKEADLTLERHFGAFFIIFSVHSSHLRAVLPLFHFSTFKNGLLSLFTLVTLNLCPPFIF